MKRTLLAGLFLAALASAGLAETGTVYKSPTCQCCSKWIAHMAKNGIELTPQNMGPAELNQLKSKIGLKPEQASCHTATIGGYVVEGHVPAEDVKRLIAEKPNAIGLSAPGMPAGSPGMETGGPAQPYDVLLVKKDGSTEVWAKH